MQWNLNIRESDLNKPIYRITSFERFNNILKNNEVKLNQPRAWDDPFEDLIRNIEFKNRAGAEYSASLGIVYAQCWSYSEENDLLWRVYSKTRDGLRIKSTPRKLIKSFITSKKFKGIRKDPKVINVSFANEEERVPEYEEIYCHIGNVVYLKQEDIAEYFSNKSLEKEEEEYNIVLNSYLVKREPFQDEKEIRLIVIHWDPEVEYNNYKIHPLTFTFDVDVNEFIEEIIFDPRISDSRFEAFSKVIRQGGYKHIIAKSTIYDKPDKIIITYR